MARPLPALSFEALEARILYSADLAPVTDVSVVKAQEDDQVAASNEVAFIDASLQDVDGLVAALQDDIDQGRQLEIIFLDPSQDGIDQISNALAGRSDLTAIHVITHGQAGAIDLGSTRLDAASLLARSEDIAAWSSALTDDADLLFYGCEVAFDDAGQALVRDLAFLTGADVAASDDLTGNALLGGDWQLEFQTGQIETVTLYSFGPIEWNGTLASTSFQQGTGGYSGTQDTYIDDSTPNTSYGAATTIRVDTGATEQQGLLRFDNIFGTDAGKIPAGATITSVTLKINVSGTDPADQVNVYRMTTSWNENTTWNNLGGVDVGTDTLASFDYQIDAGTSGTVAMSSAALTASVQAWANNPSSNYGWAFISVAADNYEFISSENPTVGARPILEVTYTAPVAPVIDLDADNSSGADTGGFFGAWTDGGGPVAVADADATLTDPDSANLNSLTVTISNPINGTNEVLAANTSGTSIVASYNASTNQLTLSGTDTVAHYQQVLRTVTYDNLAGTPDTTVRSITFVANDGSNNSNTAVSTLSMTGVNTAPTGADKTIVIAEDGSYTFTRADFGFSDVDGDSFFRVWIYSLPDQGYLLWNGATFTAGNWIDVGDIDAGQLIYRPPPDASGTPLATFTFRVQDDGGTVGGGADTDPVANTMTLQVNTVNDAPLVALGPANLVTNGSFESGGSGWTGNGGVEAVTGKEAEFAIPAAPDGSYIVEVEGSFTSPADSYIEQTITTEVGKTYVFSLWAVTRNQLNTQDMGMLSVNGVELDRFTTGTTWHEYAVSFTATSTSSTIRITSLGSDLDSSFAGSGDSVGLLVDDVRVVAVNNTASYTENGAAVVLASSASLFDLEHQTNDDFNGATLTLTRNGGASADDVYGASGTLSALTEGGALVVGGTTIGTVTTNSSGVLTLTFSAGATTALVDQAASQITYANSSDGPPSSLQMNWSLADGNGGSGSAYTTVSIATSNDAPVLNFVGGSANYPENYGPVVLAPFAEVTDPDSADFDGGQLVVTITANGSAGDRLGIQNQGAGAGQIGVSGSNVTYGGVVIGTFTGGDGSTPLVISFNSNATLAAVTALAKNTTYENVSDDPSTATKTLQGYITDGDGGTSNVASGTLTVTPINDAPVVTLSGNAYDFYEGYPAIYDTGATVTDVDSSNFDGGVLTFSINSGGGTGDVLSLRNVGTGPGQLGISGSNVTYGGVVIGTWSGNGDGSTALTVTFNANASTAAVQETVRGLSYQNTSEDPTAGIRQFSITVTDGDGGTSAPAVANINVIPVNDAPTITSNGGGASAAVSVSENQSGVTTVAAGDPEAADTLTYSLVGGADQARFSINSSTGVLTFNAAPDFETPADFDGNNIYEVTVQVSDGNGGTDTQAISVTVTNVNETPTLVSLSNSTVAENTDTSGGYSMGSLSTTDPDAGDTFTYTVVGGADQAAFSIGGAGSNELVITDGTLDFETQSSYSVIVRSTDAGGLARDETFTISVTNVNETPTLVNLSNSTVAENTDTSGGYSVGSLSTSDPDAGDTFTYTVVGGADQAVFSIGGAGSNELVITDGTLDFETQSSYTVIVRSTDAGGLTRDETFTITVSDQNEAPSFSSTPVTAVNEDAPYSYSITTTDPDAGATLTITATKRPAWLTLTDNGDGTATLSGTPTNAEVGSHSVVLQVSDGTFTDTQSYTVTVSNTNDAPTITSAATASVAENQTSATTVTASDVDVGDTPSYSIIGGADQALFSINSSTGVLTFNAAPDFETPADFDGNNIYEVTVQAADGNGGTDTQAISVTVTNVNETPTLVSLSNSTVAENTDTSGGYSVGSLSTTDPDAGDSFTYTVVGGADQAVFSIGGAGSNELVLTDGTLDFETQSSYTVIVRSTDAGGLTRDETFTITVTDQNEAPSFTSSPVTTVNEDAPYSYSITITDPDAGATLTITATTRPAWLTLTDNGDGTATLSGTPTNAEVGSHSVVLQVSDGTFTDTQSYTVTVINTNDAPTITSAATASVAENQTGATTVTASDVDAGDTPSYSIIGGADQALFSINSSTGVLTFNAAPDFETPADFDGNNIYEVTVQAADGNGGTDTQAISVTVTNVNETPTLVSLSNSTVAENTDTSGGYSVGSLSTTDPDAGDTFTYTVVGGADQAVFSIGGAGSNELVLSDGTLDFETQSSYTVVVRSTDAGGLTRDESFTISVSDQNEAPSFTSTPVTTGTEGAAYTYAITVTDPDAGAVLSIADTTLPAWLTLTDHGNGTATLSGTPGLADAGNHAVSLQVSDGLLNAVQSFTIVVANSNSAPIITSDGGGDTASLSVTDSAGAITTVSATDADPGDTQSFSIVGGADAPLFVLDSATGVLRFVTPEAGQPGSDANGDSVFEVIVGVSDASGSTDAQALSIRLDVAVAPEPPPVLPPTPTPETPPPTEPAPPEVPENEPTPGVPDNASTPDAGEAASAAAEDGTGERRGAAEARTIRVDIVPPRPVLQMVAADVTTPDQAVPQFDLRLVNVPVAPMMTPFGMLNLPDQQVSLSPEVQAQIEAAGDEARLSLVEVGVSGSVLTVGVIWWATRVGSLVGAMMATVPAWRSIDPMPIVRDGKPKLTVSDEDEDATDDVPPADDPLEGGR